MKPAAMTSQSQQHDTHEHRQSRWLQPLLLLMCSLLFWASSIAWAGSVTLSLTATAEASQEFVKLDLQVQNLGDETAKDLTIKLDNQQERILINQPQDLSPGQTITSTWHSIQSRQFMPGRHFFPLYLAYTDQNGYSFEVVHLIKVNIGAVGASGLKLGVEPLHLSNESSFHITLENSDQQTKMVGISIALPMGIQATEPAVVTLAATEKQTLSIPIKHQELWPNLYQGHVIATFQHQGILYSEAIELSIDARLSEPSGLFNPTLLIVILSVLLFGAAVILLRSKFRNKR